MPGLWKRLRTIVVPTEEDPGRRRALRLVGLAVLAAFAALGLARVDRARLLESLSGADPRWLLLAACSNVLSLVAHALRWGAVVRPRGLRVKLRDVFAAMVSAYAIGIVLPARAADLAKAHLLARRAGLSTTSVLAAVLLDFVIGVASLVPLAALLALTGEFPWWARRAVIAFSIVAACGAVAVFVLRPRADAALDGHGVAGLVRRLRSGLSAVHDPRAIAASFAWGFAGWGAEILVALCALAAFGLPTTIAAAGLVSLATTAANVIALSPGNAGPFELAAVLALGGLGVAAEPALAFALLYHLAHLVPAAIFGSTILVREARRG